jgi:hypothetical protein
MPAELHVAMGLDLNRDNRALDVQGARHDHEACARALWRLEVWRTEFNMAEHDEFERALSELKADEVAQWAREYFVAQDERVRRRMLDGVLAAVRRRNPEFQIRTSKDEHLEDEVAAWATQEFESAAVESVAVEALLDRVNRQYLTGDFQRVGRLYGRLFWGLEQWERARPDESTGDEMLNGTLEQAGLRYLVSLFLTTPAAGRPRAMLHGCDLVDRMCLLVDPMKQLLDEAPLEIGDSLRDFEPAWQDLLERELIRTKEEGHDLWPLLGWFTKSVQRSGVAGGLLRVARLSDDPVTWEEWVDELIRAEAWSDVIETVSEALSSVGRSLFGARLADLAVAAAFRVEACPERLRWAERAFRSEPTIRRLLILSVAEGEQTAAAADREYLSLMSQESIEQGDRVVSAAYLLSGQWADAAHLLARADGLGWSHSRHPGRLVFPALLWLLRQVGEPDSPQDESTPSPILTEVPHLVAACVLLEQPGADTLDTSLLPQRRLPDALERVLPKPALVQVLAGALRQSPPDAQAMETVMQSLHMTVMNRVSAALRTGRRRMYDDACRQLLALVEALIVTGRMGEARSLFGRCSNEGRDDAAWVGTIDQLLGPELRAALQ